jgi:hypothetical protein
MHYRVPVDSNKEPGQTVGKKVPLSVTQNAAETTATAISVRLASRVIYLLLVVNDYVLELFTLWSGPV